MSTHDPEPTDPAGPTEQTDPTEPAPTQPIDLPPLDDARVDAIEDAVFARIGADRRQGRVRRRRAFVGVGAAASVVAIAAVIAPSVIGGMGTATNESAIAPAISGGGMPAFDSPVELEESLADQSAIAGSGLESVQRDSSASMDLPANRDIIANGSLSLTVDDVSAAASEVSSAAEAAGGYVESLTLGSEGVGTLDGSGMTIDVYPYPPVSPGATWVQVRVPADRLTEVMDELKGLGTVESSSISRQDVTEQTADLRGRVAAMEASVARLTELMGEATSVADLIAAESALADRQATLEAYRQQLTMTESQIAMSSLSVDLSPVRTAEANPSGFGDGLVAGWNGLIATLNGIVLGLGFLIPWIAVIAVAATIVWLVVRTARRRRRPKDDAGAL